MKLLPLVERVKDGKGTEELTVRLWPIHVLLISALFVWYWVG